MTTLRDAGIYGDFVHEPLSDPQTEIRLVQVEPPNGIQDDGEIHCTISSHLFKLYGDPPPIPYIAISYTWGDTSKKRGIWINKRRLKIGYNSWLAIWQARLHCPQQPLRVWIDVLSINQANDDEKSVQVGLMGNIFEFAKCVFASVGVHEDDSEFLMQETLAHAEYIEHRRMVHGQKEDTPLEPGCCKECGQSLISIEDICIRCLDNHPRFSPTRDRKCSKCHRNLTITWYEGPFGVKFCRTCNIPHRIETDDDDDLFEPKLSDDWGAVDRPARSHPVRPYWDTHARFLEMSQESQQRIANALLEFSLRTYFTRLWIIQEIKITDSSRVFIVCGESVFTLDALFLFVADLDRSKDRDEILRPAFQDSISAHLRGLFEWRCAQGTPIWALASTHHNYHCVDTRDRVFGLLSLTLTVLHPFPADYTKSNFQVLLQLLEQETHVPADVVGEERADRFYLMNYLNVIGGFLLGPLATEIATMLRLRRATLVAPDPPPLTREQYIDSQIQRKVVLEVLDCCTIWEDADGNMVSSFSKGDDAPTHMGDRDFRHVEQNPEKITVKVRTPMGMTSASVGKNVRAGDSILLLRDGINGPRAPITGLVVRPFERDLHIIVGQVVVGDEFTPSAGAGNVFDGSFCDGIFLWDWLVFMSPADFILFVAQDLKSYISPPEEGVGPAVVWSVCPEEIAKRLTTSVTSDPVSSFAIRREDRSGKRWWDFPKLATWTWPEIG